MKAGGRSIKERLAGLSHGQFQGSGCALARAAEIKDLWTAVHD